MHNAVVLKCALKRNDSHEMVHKENWLTIFTNISWLNASFWSVYIYKESGVSPVPEHTLNLTCSSTVDGVEPSSIGLKYFV